MIYKIFYLPPTCMAIALACSRVRRCEGNIREVSRCGARSLAYRQQLLVNLLSRVCHNALSIICPADSVTNSTICAVSSQPIKCLSKSGFTSIEAECEQKTRSYRFGAPESALKIIKSLYLRVVLLNLRHAVSLRPHFHQHGYICQRWQPYDAHF